MAEDKITEQSEQEQQQEQGLPFTVQDLVTLKSAIELGTQRGAWRANELTAVGQVYDRLSAFVASLLPKQDPKKDASEEKGE